MDIDIRALAFYLPQYHPIPENDEWWGKGFTEWRNVVSARPLFPGHYQPHLPADLGFYDLRLPETREAHAELAREHGIHGFCYYHYWFNGRRILERPFDEVLSSGKPEFPFCLCWANENWTRVWDGGERDILLAQRYSHEDDLAHIQSLIPAFRDPRYIRVDGKPLFLVYRTALLPDPAETARIWRQAVREAGLKGIYLVRVESHVDNTEPASIGFDASVEFAPFNGLKVPRIFNSPVYRGLAKLKMVSPGLLAHNVLEYRKVAHAMISRRLPVFTRFHCVSPGWDNTPRRQSGGMILFESTPSIYKKWLRAAAESTLTRFRGDERLLFINAWNEWAEGNHLEPDQRWGLSFLEATREALQAKEPNGVQNKPRRKEYRPRSHINRIYWGCRSWLGSIGFRRFFRQLRFFRPRK